jgi:rod shape determining protein RodA
MQSWFRNLDYGVLLGWFGLMFVGLVAIYSTTHGPAAEYLPETAKMNFERQLMWGGISLFVIGLCLILPSRFYQAVAFPSYVVSLALLAATIVFGTEVNGAKSWLDLGGGIRLQTGEFAKVGTVLAVAALLSMRRPNSGVIRYGAAATLLLILPAVLVLLQNDTGTALVFLGLIPIMLFWSGLPLYILALMISPAIAGYFAVVNPPIAVGFGIVFTIGVFLATRRKWATAVALVFTLGTVGVANLAIAQLQPHQVARIVSFTNPEAEEFRSGVGYHLVQSKAAIGSGGILGKGFMEGTQTQGAYIPEQSTDFVFSIIGEEFGFVGGVIVLLLYGFLLVRLVQLGTRVKHPLASMMAAGAAGVFLIHLFVNLGMVTGLLPVIGIPLPFISYGGSALLANSIMIGVVLALYLRRDDFSIYGY